MPSHELPGSSHGYPAPRAASVHGGTAQRLAVGGAPPCLRVDDPEFKGQLYEKSPEVVIENLTFPNFWDTLLMVF
jgi:hypothetical protein